MNSRKNIQIAAALFLISLALLMAGFFDGVALMVKWWSKPEYSHGYFIPLIAVYLAYRKLPEIMAIQSRPGTDGRILGLALIVIGIIMLLMGELSSLYTIIQYGFLLAFWGLVLAFTGMRITRLLVPTLVFLLFMIPLPNFLYFNLSNNLQLISSFIGVAVLRLFDISVYLQGNVIDLGNYKLQVVDACSGLRYLFPLMCFGYLVAYLFKAPFWQKAFIFLSTIPITIMMNSFRIAVIGVTVNQWGIAAAEGFLHYFEGWVVFMACLALLTLEMWIFKKISRLPGSLLDYVDLNLPDVSWKNLLSRKAPIGLLTITVTSICFSAVIVHYVIADREDVIPERSSFASLPLYKGNWVGRESSLDGDVLETLQVTDYMLANYRNIDGGAPINFYLAYYESQRKGASIHSPKSCIPGGGWQISEFSTETFPDITDGHNQPLRFNRAIIEKNNSRDLVYYWFQQRGRNITNEYIAKWYIFWDALTLQRTDGALIRVVTSIPENGSVAEADNRLKNFISQFNPLLSDYIPD